MYSRLLAFLLVVLISSAILERASCLVEIHSLKEYKGVLRCWVMKYRIVIEQDEDGAFVAEVPSLPGCISEGNTRAEALNNIKDAIKGYLISLKKHNDPIPPPIDEEIVEIDA